jgi:hypothetical protein
MGTGYKERFAVFMKNRADLVRFILTLATVIAATSTAHAQEQQFGGGCLRTSLGQLCSPPGGGIQKDMRGDVVCGHGQCIKDLLGDIVCARQPGGYATKDSMGQVLCTGGCEHASASYCQSPR